MTDLDQIELDMPYVKVAGRRQWLTTGRPGRA